MVPLASFLRLKTSVDVEPGTAEDRALLLVDQGKHAVDPFLRRTLLVRAAQQLDIAVREEAEEIQLARFERHMRALTYATRGSVSPFPYKAPSYWVIHSYIIGLQTSRFKKVKFQECLGNLTEASFCALHQSQPDFEFESENRFFAN